MKDQDLLSNKYEIKLASDAIELIKNEMKEEWRIYSTKIIQMIMQYHNLEYELNTKYIQIESFIRIIFRIV
jgi:hypothetical protein